MSAGAAGGAPSEQRRARQAGSSGAAKSSVVARIQAAIFALLVLATCGGLFLAQRLKHAPTVVHGFLLKPATLYIGAPQDNKGEQLSFQLDHRDRVSVEIVNNLGEAVATLVRELPWPAYLRLCLRWNGHRGFAALQGHNTTPLMQPLDLCQEAPVLRQPRGALVPAGEYRVRVDLRVEGRSVLSPAGFTLARPGGSR